MARSTKVTQNEIHTKFLDGTYSGVVMAIDPGQKNMGWAVIEVPKNEDTYNSSRIVLGYGTIYGKGKGGALSASILDNLVLIWEEYNIDILAIEDYHIIKGKSKGVFVIPGLIYSLKYLWYKSSGKDAIMVYAATWKSSMGLPASADKNDVKDNLRTYLPAKKIREIEDEFEASGHRGEQDCIDAICIGMYICKRIILNHRLKPKEKR